MDNRILIASYTVLILIILWVCVKYSQNNDMVACILRFVLFAFFTGCAYMSKEFLYSATIAMCYFVLLIQKIIDTTTSDKKSSTYDIDINALVSGILVTVPFVAVTGFAIYVSSYGNYIDRQMGRGFKISATDYYSLELDDRATNYYNAFMPFRAE